MAKCATYIYMYMTCMSKNGYVSVGKTVAANVYIFASGPPVCANLNLLFIGRLEHWIRLLDYQMIWGNWMDLLKGTCIRMYMYTKATVIIIIILLDKQGGSKAWR